MRARLLRLKITNFLSYKNLELDLPQGLVAIVGPNGAGKSSIVDALAFGLGGSSVSHTTTKGSLIRWGSSRAIIQLELNVAGKKYRVIREISKNGSTASLWEGSKVIARGVSKVDSELPKLLGFSNSKTFLEIAFVPQGKLTELIELTPSNLRNKALSLIGLSNKDKVEKYLREKISYYKGLAQRLSYVQSEIDEYSKRKKELLKIINSIEKNIAEIEKTIAEEEKKKDVFEAELKRLDELKGIYEEKKRRLEELEEALSRLKRHLTELEDINEDRLKEIRKRLEKINKLEPKYKELKYMLEKIERKKRYLNELEMLEERVAKLSTLDKEITKVYSELEVLKKRKEDILNSLSDARARRKTIEKELSNLRRIKGFVEKVVRQFNFVDVDDMEDAIREYERRLEKLEEEIEQIMDEISKIKAAIEERRKSLELLRGKNKCPVCGAPLTEDHRRFLEEKYAKEITEMSERLAQLRKYLERKQEEFARLRHELEKMQRVYNKAVAALESVSLGDLVALEMEISTKEKDKIELEEVIERLNKELTSLNTRLEELEYRYRKLVDKRSHLIATRKNMEYIRSELKRMEDVDVTKEAEVRKELEEVEKEMQELGDREELEKAMQELSDKVELKKKYETEKSLKERELRRLKNELELLAYDEQRHEYLKREVKKLENELQEFKKTLGHLRGTLEKSKEELEEIKKKEEKKRKELEEVKKADEFAKFLEQFKQKFSNTIVNMITESFRREWQEESNKILKMFDLSVASITITEVKEARQKGWKVRAFTNSGEEVDVGGLSGGEKVGVALAMKLGLAKILSRGKLSFLVLDEPTAYLDAERRQTLKQVLSNSIGPSLEQLFVVTHDRELIDVADQVCEVRKTANGSQVSCSSS